MKSKRILAGIIASIITVAIMTIGIRSVAKENSDTIDIVFTHDIHSFLESYDVTENGQVYEVGGMPRISTFIKEKKAINPDTMVLDAGDYPMGTLYQTLFSTHALEYRMLSALNYDAITFGNHDFDYGADGLASQFEAAKEACDYYPQFIICNVDWTVEDEATKKVYDALKDMNLCEYAIFERNGMKIGVTGCFGIDALSCAPTCELTIKDPVESVRNTVDEMIKNDNPDMIICISHSGTSDDLDTSEDVMLAKAVPEIDFIVSGHSHTVIDECIKVNDTYIGSCGCYTRYAGYAQFSKNDNGRFDLNDYEVVEMDSTIEEDPEVVGILDEFKSTINENYLKEFGYTAEQTIAVNNYEFATVDDVYDKHVDHNLGNIISDSYRWYVDNSDTGDDNPVTVSVAPAGTIRGTYNKGEISVSDVYESFSLGQGMDDSVGYPLIDLYLSGKELKTLCEVDASVSDIMNIARLYMSGIEYTFNPNRVIFNKVIEVNLNPEIMNEETDTQIEDDKLYRVVTDLYSGRMLAAVTDVSHGLLSIVPKDATGKPLEKIEDAIAHDINTGKELKTWVAIAKYMQHFDSDGDKVGEIPIYYVNPRHRKVNNDSFNPVNLIKNPNKFFFAIVGAGILLVVLIIVLIKLLVSAVRKIKSKYDKSKDGEKAENNSEVESKE